jgi:hypothetical protein
VRLRALGCLLRGGHRWTEWALRPSVIAVRVEWLYWFRKCMRGCGSSADRWFRVAAPFAPTEPMKAVEYAVLATGGMAPVPEEIPARPLDSRISAEEAAKAFAELSRAYDAALPQRVDDESAPRG